MTTRLDDAPHFVYRYYNADGVALYVGCTHNVAKREAQHRSKEWFPLVVTRRVDEYVDRSSGRLAEQAAIKREQPICNQLMKYPPASEWALQLFEAIAREPHRGSEILREFEGRDVERRRAEELQEKRELVTWKRTRRRLRESQYRAALWLRT